MRDASQRGECDSTARHNAAKATRVGERIEKHNFVSGGTTASSGGGGGRSSCES